ncbi:Uncharacterised protein [Candidatus Bartonella washoeensis]|uniref:Uncharacterized protein n=1 Tax=Candidatus Bartonella washoeensis Sb944nv TaxID=1094563 RepID=J0YV40_9HYPH|nr:hypothetical protein MCQ_00944 [Bartonella washoeensis Sb944nv]SPU26549.1 Uncharacterised protein [Bartonella washoeensis]
MAPRAGGSSFFKQNQCDNKILGQFIGIVFF